MLNKYDIEKIRIMGNQRFYSEKLKCFVEIKGNTFIFNRQTINLKDILILDDEKQDLIKTILQDSNTKCRLDKRKSHAFGKDIYLIGKNTDGELLWLEAPSWDCNWYWGFGYIETYTNNTDPSRARDTTSHSHINGLTGKLEYWDSERQCRRLSSEYVHNIYDSPKLVENTFTYEEGWKLSELFRQFYLLKDMAEYTYRNPAGCHLTTSPVEQDRKVMTQWHEYINVTMIPKITAEILRILDPEEEVKNETC